MFKRISGKPKIEWLPVKVSVAFAYGALSYADGSGYQIVADATSGDHFGINLKAIASTDADYAVARKIPIDFIGPEDVMEADVTGTATVAMVGNAYDLDATGLLVDVGATSKKVVTIVGFISASKVLVKLNAVYTSFRVATT